MVVGGADDEKVKSDLTSFRTKLKTKQSRYKSDLEFLEYFFYKVHSKYLREYEEFTSFSQLLSVGKYNCLTATSLYSVLLSDLGYNFQIKENRFHIYIELNVEGEEIILEATDPMNGFVRGKDILAKKAMYAKIDTDGTGTSANSIDNTVDVYQLVGLNYYNLAIDLYNKKDLGSAYKAINKAMIFYQSDRMYELAQLILERSMIPGRHFFLNALAAN